MADVSIQTIQSLMGHKSLTMTLRYSHLSLATCSSRPKPTPRRRSDYRIRLRGKTEFRKLPLDITVIDPKTRPPSLDTNRDPPC